VASWANISLYGIADRFDDRNIDRTTDKNLGSLLTRRILDDGTL
jgi:hypothetical protein